ncbi:MAG TPA: phospholipase D-like domain-containing protein [Casimicrobiaceae bacterium]|nr:phospholipase D-like domain-containing protein [Casimicrobiaceae bacterium]
MTLDPQTKKLPLILATFAVTAAVTLLAVNFSVGEKQITERITHTYTIADPQFRRSMGVLLGPPLVDGNRVDTLVNGREIFPSMLAAIKSARKTVTFETYIYWSGRIGKEFADALADRARAGVRVHVLVDWIGSSRMDSNYLDTMKRAGVEIEKYHPPRWYTLHKLNNRTHRKLLVVDGRVGFTGGVGIADEWDGNAEDPAHWRDTHFRLEGPAVAQMQAAFTDNWLKVTGNVLDGRDYFPAETVVGPELGQVFKSSREGGSESMHLMYLLSTVSAVRNIDLAMAYFVPDELAETALVEALARGVKFRMILPGPYTDTEVLRKASRAKWGRLLRAGAEIYEYQPTMFHCKVLVVDGIWTSVGSTNFDNRSFRLNDEANLNVYSRAFAERQLALFNDDLKRSRRITLEEWEQRPWMEKLQERIESLVDSQL